AFDSSGTPNRRDYPFDGHAPHLNDLQALRTYIERYEYDAVENLVQWHHVANSGSWTRDYTYSEKSLIETGKLSSRLTKTKIGNGVSQSEAYGYADAQGHDVDGCMTSINNLKMVWNFEGQMQQVDFEGGGKAYYVYSSTGQRIRKIIHRQNGTRQAERIYLGNYEIYREYHGNGETVRLDRETLHVTDDKQRIALVETKVLPTVDSSLIRYQLGNHLGSASVELDEAGAFISYEEYHPYGTTAFQARAASEVSLKRYRFSAKERDEETGFSFHGARYYAPWLARWTATDPAGLEDGINLFTYVHNNPVIFFDPTGKEADKGFLAGMGSRFWERATAPTEAQKAFKERRYGDWAKHSAIDAALSFNPIVAMTVGDIQLARAAVDVPGQVKDAATLPRND
ncbi:MAG TPA: RHS repeat-associated core domain-containing protein, partial [Terrimicrobiaceae bacterium]